MSEPEIDVQAAAETASQITSGDFKPDDFDWSEIRDLARDLKAALAEIERLEELILFGSRSGGQSPIHDEARAIQARREGEKKS